MLSIPNRLLGPLKFRLHISSLSSTFSRSFTNDSFNNGSGKGLFKSLLNRIYGRKETIQTVGEIYNECNKYKNIISEFKEEYSNRKRLLSQLHDIPFEEIDTKLPPDCKNMDRKAVNFHLKGVGSITHHDLFMEFIAKINSVTGVYGAPGTGKTSSVLSLAHYKTEKENQRYVIYTICNGKVPDGNYKQLESDIKTLAQPYPVSEWKTYGPGQVQLNLQKCHNISENLVYCDVLSRVLLLKLLIDNEKDLSPHLHIQVQFSLYGDKFIRNMYEYLKRYDSATVTRLLFDSLAYVKECLENKVIFAIDEAFRAVNGFPFLLAHSVIDDETLFSQLYNRVAGVPSSAGVTGTGVIGEVYKRGYLQYDYSAVCRSLPFIAIGSHLKKTHLRFSGSGGPYRRQVKDVVFVNSFDLLKRQEVIEHLKGYPTFKAIIKDIIKYFEDSKPDWDLVLPRQLEDVLYRVYNFDEPILKSFADVIKETTLEIKQAVDEYMEAVPTEDLIRVISNTNNAIDDYIEVQRSISIKYPTKDHFDVINADTRLEEALNACDLATAKVPGRNEYALQQPSLVHYLKSELDKRLKTDITGISSGERILCIDGGGSSGIVPLRVLHYIETRLGGKTIGEVFDRVVGVSAGGIIGMGITAGLTIKELEDSFFDIVSAVWPETIFEKTSQTVLTIIEKMFEIQAPGVGVAQWRSENLKNAVSKHITPKLDNKDDIERPLTEILYPQKNKTPKLIIPSIFVSQGKQTVAPVYFANYISQNITYKTPYDNSVLNAVASTSAIVNLFKNFGNFQGEFGEYRDGGYMCNNPSINGFLFHFYEYKNTSPLIHLSLGCGKKKIKVSAKEQAHLYVGGANSLSGRLNINTEKNHESMIGIYGDEFNALENKIYFRIDPPLTNPVGIMDTVSDVKDEIESIDKSIEEICSKELDQIIKLLKYDS